MNYLIDKYFLCSQAIVVLLIYSTKRNSQQAISRSGKGSIIEVPLQFLTSLRTHLFISKKRFLVLFPIKHLCALHDFCCQALLAIMGIIVPKKIYWKLLDCPANLDINPLLPWPAHIAILPLFNLFFFWGVGLKIQHFNSISVHLVAFWQVCRQHFSAASNYSHSNKLDFWNFFQFHFWQLILKLK